MSESEVLSHLCKAKYETVAKVLNDPEIECAARVSFAKQVLISSGDRGVTFWASSCGWMTPRDRYDLRDFIVANKAKVLAATLKSRAEWVGLLKFVAPVSRHGDALDTPQYYISWWLTLLGVAKEREWSNVQDMLRDTYAKHYVHDWLAIGEMAEVMNHPYIMANPHVLPADLFGYYKGLKLGLAQATLAAAAKKLIDCPEIIGHALEVMNQVEVQEETQYV